METTKSLKKALEKTTNKRRGIAQLEHPVAEIILNRRIADVSTVNYWLRCHGDRVEDQIMEESDQEMRGAIEHALGGQMQEDSWCQATLPVKLGGLGMRRAKDTAVAAFQSSAISARPLVTSLFERMEEKNLGKVDDYTECYDGRIMAALDRLCAGQAPHTWQNS